MRPLAPRLLPAVLALGAGCSELELAPSPVAPGDRSPAWEPLDSPVDVHCRGLCAVSDDVVWGSGMEGTWFRTTDGGRTWHAGRLASAAELDLRDVHAFDAAHALVMSAGPGEDSRVYTTRDGGATWIEVHRETAPEGFLDGMAFWDRSVGVVVGDPVDGRLTILRTTDGGASWERLGAGALPPARPGEYAFAASGTSVAVSPGGIACIVTGGAASRAYRSSDWGATWSVQELPLESGKDSRGAFSVAFRDDGHALAVGGDYLEPERVTANAARSTDGGLGWAPAAAQPPGYRSGVAGTIDARPALWVAVGAHGSDLSTDDGASWTPLEGGFHAVAIAPHGLYAWAVGAEGRLARLALPRSHFRAARPDQAVRTPSN